MTSAFSHALARRRPPLSWQIARLLLAGSRSQAFLDQPWIAPLLDSFPASARRAVALRILGLSPHYFIHQWTAAYPKQAKRAVVLEAEAQRNQDSRTEIVKRLLAPYLHPTMAVLDFGCGPGFLAREISRYVDSVIAVDISRGTIACARYLNPANNISYLHNRPSDLKIVADSSIDLAVSFAVFQHLAVEQTVEYLKELQRVLRPGGSGICQFAVTANPWDVVGPRSASERLLLDRYRLNFRTYSTSELSSLFARAGFPEATIRPVQEVADIADHVGGHYLAMFHREVAPDEQVGGSG